MTVQVNYGAEKILDSFTTEGKQPTALNATVSSTTAYATKNFTVMGQLTASGSPLPWKTIALQRSTDNKTFVRLATKSTDGNGWYRFSKNQTAAGK